MPSRFRAVAWMGGVDLDLRAAEIPPGGAELEVMAVLGVVTVWVPWDLPVVVIGDAVTQTPERGAQRVRPVAGATVRIRGRAILGKVHVRFVEPGARASAHQHP